MAQKLIYYTVSNTSILYPDINNERNIKVYTNTSSSIISEGYPAGGGGSQTHVIRVQLISGSNLIASFPYEDIDFYINSSSYYTITSSGLSTLQYYVIPNNISFNTSSYFRITDTSSLSTFISFSLDDITTQGNINLVSSSVYKISLYTGLNQDSYNYFNVTDKTGSLVFFTSSLGNSSSINLTLTSSDFYTIETKADFSPYLILTYNDVGEIPVSPTNSLSGWNTYLNTDITNIFSSASTVYLIGFNLNNQENLTIPPGNKLDTIILSGSINNLTYCNFSGSTINTFPNLQNNPKLSYIDISHNDLSGSIPNISNYNSLEFFIANNNNYSNYASQSGYLVSPLLSYIDLSYNNLSTSSIDSILYDLAYSSSITGGTLYLTGSNNSGPSIVSGNYYYDVLHDTKGWTIFTNPFGS